MGQISSINFKKSTDFQVFHNANIRPNYAIGGIIECNRNGYEAKELKQQIIQEAKEIYAKTCKSRNKHFKATSYEWSAVVNIKPNTNMQDLENLAKHFSDKYKIQCYQIAIHRDEGHINEKGEKVINHHAHLEFITLDKDTGKNMWRREFITPRVLREMQSEVAEILQMQRGQDKRLSGAKRVEPRIYARMKEQEKKALQSIKKELLTQKEISQRLEAERKAWIKEGGHTKDDYAKLRSLKGKEYESKEDLEKEIKEINYKIKNKNLEIQYREKKIEEENPDDTGLMKNIKKIEDNHLQELKKELRELEQEQENIEKRINENKGKENIAENQTNIAQKSTLSDKERERYENEIKTLKTDYIKLKQEMAEMQENFINETKEAFKFKDSLDLLLIEIEHKKNKIDNLYPEAKEKRIKEIDNKADEFNKLITDNLKFEKFFSFEKYKKAYKDFKNWVKEKLQNLNKNNKDRNLFSK